MTAFATVRARTTAWATLSAGVVLIALSLAWLSTLPRQGLSSEGLGTTSTARTLLYLGIPFALILLAGVVWLALGSAMRRLDSMAGTLAQIDVNQLQLRVPETAENDEIGRLAHSMNAMLDRIETATNQQRSLVADASHDLQSPLTGLRTEFEVALARPDKVDVATWARRLLAASTDMELLVSDLHLLALAEDSHAALKPKSVDLGSLVLEEVDKATHETGPTIEVKAAAGITVCGDPSLLRRMVRNLLDNAVRHAQSTVHLLVEKQSDIVILDVIDDGPGVSDVDRTRVFERFYRGEATEASDATRPQGGSGLGLAIVRHVAERHGGTAGLLPDVGAHFRVQLPIQP